MISKQMIRDALVEVLPSMLRNTTVRFRRGTSAEWAASTRILGAGEPGYDTTQRKHKVGDGSSTWAALPFQEDLGGDGGPTPTPSPSVSIGTAMPTPNTPGNFYVRTLEE